MTDRTRTYRDPFRTTDGIDHPGRLERRAVARLTLFATALGVVLLGLLPADPGLPAPPGVAAAAWPRWIERVGPAPVLISGVRLLGIAAAGYLLVVVAIELIGRAT